MDFKNNLLEDSHAPQLNWVFRSPVNGGFYNFQMTVYLQANQGIIFHKAEFKRRVITKPRWWEFWKNEVIEETITPVPLTEPPSIACNKIKV